MENHRLQQMKEGYSPELFNKLYKETEGLRRSLSNQISARRYGVTQDEILSWFDDKFIFVFNKYFDKLEEGLLRGYIINALKTFKLRVLRKAYSGESEIYSNIIDIDDKPALVNIIPDSEEMGDKELLFELMLSFFKKELTDDAMLVLEVELTPPSYITDKLKSPNSSIPAKLICDYLGLPITKDTIQYINYLRTTIKETTIKAREHFQSLAFSAN